MDAPNPLSEARVVTSPFAVPAIRRELPVEICPPAESAAVVTSSGSSLTGAVGPAPGAATRAFASGGGLPVGWAKATRAGRTDAAVASAASEVRNVRARPLFLAEIVPRCAVIGFGGDKEHRSLVPATHAASTTAAR